MEGFYSDFGKFGFNQKFSLRWIPGFKLLPRHKKWHYMFMFANHATQNKMSALESIAIHIYGIDYRDSFDNRMQARNKVAYNLYKDGPPSELSAVKYKKDILEYKVLGRIFNTIMQSMDKNMVEYNKECKASHILSLVCDSIHHRPQNSSNISEVNIAELFTEILVPYLKAMRRPLPDNHWSNENAQDNDKTSLSYTLKDNKHSQMPLPLRAVRMLSYRSGTSMDTDDNSADICTDDEDLYRRSPTLANECFIHSPKKSLNLT